MPISVNRIERLSGEKESSINRAAVAKELVAVAKTLLGADKRRDYQEFYENIARLEREGKQYGESDSLTEMLGGEKFSHRTRQIITDIVYLIEDYPELGVQVPEKLRHFLKHGLLTGRKERLEDEKICDDSR
jgi:hypothetical protein